MAVDDFVIFICTHGRPNSQYTYETLRRCNYTGRIIFVVDDKDETAQQYIDKYGAGCVHIFNKDYYINSDRFDNGVSNPSHKCVVYAKRAVEDLADSMNLKYFAISDDDITEFTIRFPNKNKLGTYKIYNFDEILLCYQKLLTDQVACVGFGYAKSYFKGVNTFKYAILSNRALPYQFLIRNNKIKVDWVSWYGEDDISAMQSSEAGNVWLSIPYVSQTMKPIGNNSALGGMVDIYKQNTEFELKYNIFKYCPNRVYFMYRNNRLYLAHNTNASYPKIISSVYKQ